MDYSKLAFTSDVNEPDSHVSPISCIEAMFEHTDTDGNLYIPKWYYGECSDAEKHFYACKMKWNENDCRTLVDRFNEHIKTLSFIAESCDNPSDSFEKNKKLFDKKIADFCNTYLRILGADEFDLDYIDLLYDKKETVNDIKKIAQKLEEHIPLDEYETSFMENYKDVALSDEESMLLNIFRAAVHKEAAQRLGREPLAEYVIVSSRRVRSLMSLGAPTFIIELEERLLAQAIAINRYAESIADVTTI